MTSCLLFPSVKKDLKNQTEYIKDFLIEKGFEVQIFDGGDVKAGHKFAIVLGGDGTVLFALKTLIASELPIFSINFGHLGFLTSADSAKLDESLSKLAKLEFEIEERNLLEVNIGDESDIALNECAITRSDPVKMVKVSVLIDNHHFSTFATDGVLVSTATGSTAYNFAAGGSIMWPDVKGMQFTVIAGQSIMPKPLIVSDKSEFKIKIQPDSKSFANAVLDGLRVHQLENGDEITVRISDQTAKFVNIFNEPFSHRLIQKFKLPL